MIFCIQLIIVLEKKQHCHALLKLATVLHDVLKHINKSKAVLTSGLDVSNVIDVINHTKIYPFYDQMGKVISLGPLAACGNLRKAI